MQSGSPAELLRAPRNAFVARFIGVDALVSGVVAWRDGGRAVIAVGATEIVAAAEAVPGERVTFGVRPEHVRVALVAPPGGDGANVVAARIAAVTPAGPFMKLRLEGALAPPRSSRPSSRTDPSARARVG